MSFVNLLELIYPIGSIYCSTSDTSPASSVGGTWTKIEDAVLRSGDKIGYIGTDTHNITTSEMPSHRHIASGVWGVTCSQSMNSGNIDAAYKNKGNLVYGSNVYQNVGGGKQCRLSSVLTTVLFGTELRRFFGGDVNGIY